jgi:hypothetical protein
MPVASLPMLGRVHTNISRHESFSVATGGNLCRAGRSRLPQSGDGRLLSKR